MNVSHKRIKRQAEEYLTCTCQHCPGKIEFPAHGVGEEVECPHCGMTTVLRDCSQRPKAPRRWPLITLVSIAGVTCLVLLPREIEAWIALTKAIIPFLIGLVVIAAGVLVAIVVFQNWVKAGIFGGLAVAFYYFFFFKTWYTDSHNIGLLNERQNGVILGLGIAILCTIVFAASKLKTPRP